MRLRISIPVLLALCIVAGCAFRNIQRDSERMTSAVEQGVDSAISFFSDAWTLILVVAIVFIVVAIVVAWAIVQLTRYLKNYFEDKQLRAKHK